MSREVVVASDLFCGGGGTSQGLVQACQELGRPVELTAINCWKRALETHEDNHPWARHIPHRLEVVRPQELFEDGRLDILVASPECTWWSVARGGRPVNDQFRSSPYVIPQWLESVEVESFLIENVPEFRNWGPLHTWGPKKGRPDRNRKGQIYKAYIQTLRAAGYSVEARVLNAADFGAYTTRRRLFILGIRGENKRIRWPEPSHCVVDKKTRQPSVKGLKPWNKARDILDFNLPNRSIFDPVKPLAWKTMKRIVFGCRKFWGLDLKPYLGDMYWYSKEEIAELPDFVPTVDVGENGLEPFIYQQTHGGRPYSGDQPLPTITGANRGELAVLKPILLPPLGYHAREGRANPARSVDEPLPTLTSRAGENRVIQPILVEYYGNGGCRAVEEPVPTVTGKDRFALVIPYSDDCYLDIRMRMLSPVELAKAMGFPEGYVFSGTKTEVVKQIGNAVEVHKARALCSALLRQGGGAA